MKNVFGTLILECFYLSSLSTVNEQWKAPEDDTYCYNNERVSLKLKGPGPVAYRNRAHETRLT